MDIVSGELTVQSENITRNCSQHSTPLLRVWSSEVSGSRIAPRVDVKYVCMYYM